MSSPAETYRLLMADVYDLAGLSRRAGEGLAALEGQTVARWHVLSVLSSGGTSVAQAARRLGLSRQSVQRVSDGLARDGLVEARANPSDRRAPHVELTEVGTSVLERIVARADLDREARLDQAGVTQDQMERARAVISALQRALSAS